MCVEKQAKDSVYIPFIKEDSSKTAREKLLPSPARKISSDVFQTPQFSSIIWE